MLEYYRQHLQPDVLLICNAVSTRSQTPAITRKLLGWVNDTQPVHDAALPGVVWAITPQDARFSTQQNLDESVQQLMGKPDYIGARCRRWINIAYNALSNG